MKDTVTAQTSCCVQIYGGRWHSLYTGTPASTRASKHRHEQTPTRANTDMFHDPHILTFQHIPLFPCPGVLHPFVLEPSLASPFFPHFCGPVTSALHVIRRRDSSPPLGSSSHESELSWCGALRVALVVVVDSLHVC